MRACIFNPYLDTLGGGERYSMAVAQVLVKNGWSVDVQWPSGDIRKDLEERFNIDLANVNFVPDIKKGGGYDLCFWVSDGSIPALKARKNLLHFQVPFQRSNAGDLLNKMKLFRIQHIICNSQFTKKFIDQSYGVNSIVIYPPVDVEKFKPKKKQNSIVYVGRFSQLAQAKRQDVLLQSFQKLYDSGEKAWSLILAGGVEVGGQEYFAALKKEAFGYPIRVEKSPSFEHIKKFYESSKVFWSAAGFEVDEQASPEKVEHFGITVVEAMSAGCVPIVYAAGGFKEIIEHGQNGFLWHSINQLIEYTNEIGEDKKLFLKLSKSAQKDAQAYSYENFGKKFLGLVR